MQAPSAERVGVGRIEMKLRKVSQLFNTLDPSPFRESDLALQAEATLQRHHAAFFGGSYLVSSFLPNNVRGHCVTLPLFPRPIHPDVVFADQRHYPILKRRNR
jgi:hypothetical protein